jgi:hypothetical protein
MRQRLMSGWFAAIALFIAAPLVADDELLLPSTPQPAAATQPTPRADLATVRRWISQLASDNYQTREAARIALMGLKRQELDTLRQAVIQHLPLAPNQLINLREIVTQVYLAGDIFIPDASDGGFLGIKLLTKPEEETYPIERGVTVLFRVPGFCAFRMLQNGDVILSIHSDAGDRVLNEAMELRRAVSSIKAGQTITLEVLRQGRILNVPITLDRRPLHTDEEAALQEFINDRADRADEIWERDFAPLLKNQLLS